MMIYTVIMFVLAAVIIAFGVLVYWGKTELIHGYHQTHVKDTKAYGKAMGKSLSVVSIPLLVTGVAALFTTSALLTLILIVGLLVSFIPLFIVQYKYNGGVF